MSALNHAFRLFKHQSGNLYVAFGRFVECGCDYFRIHASCHVGHLLRTLVDEQDNHVCFRMVFRDCVGNIFKQDCLTGFRGCHDKSALTFADRREHVDDACRDVAGGAYR